MLTTQVKPVSLFSNILMVLTSIHHVYGAIIYSTPWRLHVLIISVPVIVITLILDRILSKPHIKGQRFYFAAYWLLILVPSLCLIGIFEGVYNHLVKDVLFYGGVERYTLLQLFPPPEYEMPNNFFFEVTGVAQAFVAILLAIKFARLTARASRNMFMAS